MANIRVHELAKQISKDTKEIKKILADNGIEVKSHMSSIDEKAVEIVKKAFGLVQDKTSESKKEDKNPVNNKADNKKKNEKSPKEQSDKENRQEKKKPLNAVALKNEFCLRP